ncbi:MAG: hypothetical protein JWO12_3525 [Frankiales bacterium]|nr:hypothetical protein [Frankiales bacterium]
MARRAREDYVRPPLVPHEPGSRSVATWRYRVVALLLLAATVALFALLFLKFSNITGGEDPGLNQGLPAPRGRAAAAL